LAPYSLARFTHSRAVRSVLRPAWLLGILALGLQARAGTPSEPGKGDIRLELSPRICTLTGHDKECETRVDAKWQSPREESLCLVIVDRPGIKRCWESFSNGTYSIELVFSDDLIFQLRDLDLQRVLASEALRVIREAVQFRHRRRQPWNIFD
jgi:hypothetical protein